MPKTILIVDDNADAREMLSTILGAHGYRVITAEDGRRALEVAKESLPDLTITDIQMPNVDGITMIKEMREFFKSKPMPIVVMSALDSAMTRKAIAAGANRSTPKPIHVGSFLKLVRQLLS